MDCGQPVNPRHTLPLKTYSEKSHPTSSRHPTLHGLASVLSVVAPEDATTKKLSGRPICQMNFLGARDRITAKNVGVKSPISTSVLRRNDLISHQSNFDCSDPLNQFHETLAQKK